MGCIPQKQTTLNQPQPSSELPKIPVNRLTMLRIQKETRLLLKEPLPNIFVKRKGYLEFHFCLYGLDGVYSQGFYHGVFQLPENYPMSPPQLKFFTQSGRFETNKPICTSFTNYHREEWSSSWNIRTLLLGLVSFMTSSESGLGSLFLADEQKIKIAKASLKRNMQSNIFVQLFEQELQKANINKSQEN